MKFSVRIIPNRCDGCWYCRPSNDKTEFVMFCLKRKIYKKNYRCCKLFTSADKTFESDEIFLTAIDIKGVVDSYRLGRRNERIRILKQQEKGYHE